MQKNTGDKEDPEKDSNNAKNKMRIFLFKMLFRLTWWVAPNKPRVNKIFDLYLEYIEIEEEYEKCQKRQAEMDACTQPRTETYEHLTCEKQRKIYMKSMPYRVMDRQRRNHYSDYEEAKRYHESS